MGRLPSGSFGVDCGLSPSKLLMTKRDICLKQPALVREKKMSFAIALSFLAQTAFGQQPTPPAIAAPGSEIFQREQRNYEDELRQSCMTENGIRLVIERWASNRARAANSPVKPATLEYDVAVAAYAQPLNMARLEQAIRANAKARSDAETIRTESGIELLRRLSPLDRAIHARSFTWMQPSNPPPACKR